jgi:hypothetical protein
MRFLLFPLLLVFSMAAVDAAPGNDPAAIAVLDFELNDLTLDPNNAAERERTASIRPLLEEALVAGGARIMRIEPAAQSAADKGFGFLFDHADEAAGLGRAAGADWVIVGRVHKASFLFVYLMVHVVEVSSSKQVADLVVEVKGPQKTLTGRGVQRLAEDIHEALTRAKARRPG